MRRWLAVTTGSLLIANGMRLRARVKGLATAAPSQDPVDDRYTFLVASGVALPDEARRAASAHAAREGLDVLDLVPQDLAPERLVDLARLVNPAAYRNNRFAVGAGACQALLVDRALLARARLEAREDYSPVDLVRVTRRLKQYAPTTCDLAFVPAMSAARDEDAAQRARLRVTAYAHPFQPLAYLPVARSVALAASCAASPGVGLAALAASAAQPALAAAGRGGGADPASALRRLTTWPALAVDRARTPRPGPDPDLARARERYQKEIASGVETFLEERRETCPWCGAGDLVPLVDADEMTSRKPGRFHYDQCAACRHIFLNPTLTPAGLDFYYRDIYDGLGAERTEGMFAAVDWGYRARVNALPAGTHPTRWLDVGGGHGHFALAAAGMLPGVAFDAVDFGDGIDEAVRRGWIRHAYRGQFPDLGDEVAGRYDVVSMFHYLEHTRDPLRELDAAAEALTDGGHLMIEVPHAHGPSFRLYGGYWLQLCPPQHLHLASPDQLTTALAERGLRTVSLEFGPAHIVGDTVGALFYLTQRMQPDPAMPWLPYEDSPARRARRLAALAAAAPLFPLAAAADVAMLPFLLTGRRSNVFRLVARKDGRAPRHAAA